MEQFLSRFLAQIERDGTLVAVERLEEMAVVGSKIMRPDPTADIATLARVLDLDDLRAHVGELHGTERPGAVLLHGQNAYAGQRQHHTGFRAINCWAMMIRCNSLVPSPITSSGASR